MTCNCGCAGDCGPNCRCKLAAMSENKENKDDKKDKEKDKGKKRPEVIQEIPIPEEFRRSKIIVE